MHPDILTSYCLASSWFISFTVDYNACTLVQEVLWKICPQGDFHIWFASCNPYTSDLTMFKISFRKVAEHLSTSSCRCALDTSQEASFKPSRRFDASSCTPVPTVLQPDPRVLGAIHRGHHPKTRTRPQGKPSSMASPATPLP
eukprot:4548623-Amphidinium_carterae.1